jgi:hypothetical protein
MFIPRRSPLLAYILFQLTILSALFPVIAHGAPKIPWEQFPQGVALALSLNSQKDGEREIGYLSLQIKNTSNGLLQFIDNGGPGVRISYIDANGSKLLLHDYLGGFIYHNKGPIAISPGNIFLRRIFLTASEYTVLRAHAVTCAIEIGDPVKRKGYLIETSPKTLTVEP